MKNVRELVRINKKVTQGVAKNMMVTKIRCNDRFAKAIKSAKSPRDDSKVVLYVFPKLYHNEIEGVLSSPHDNSSVLGEMKTLNMGDLEDHVSFAKHDVAMEIDPNMPDKDFDLTYREATIGDFIDCDLGEATKDQIFEIANMANAGRMDEGLLALFVRIGKITEESRLLSPQRELPAVSRAVQ